MTRFLCVLVLAGLFAAPRAFAQQRPQPAPQPQPQPQQQPPADPSKMDAKALMQTGVKLLEAKDYLGALAIFRDAYARFPSAKILLNIGTTLKLLDRKAEAANTYQRYLDSGDADSARKPQVSAEILELDKHVGVLELDVTPADAEVKVPGEDWMPAARAKVWRVQPGAFTVDVRKTGFLTGAQSGTVTAGSKAAVTVVLDELPKSDLRLGEADLIKVEQAEKPRSRVGAIAMIHVSVRPKLGSAALIGATVDLTPQLGLDGAVLLGPGLVSDGMATRQPPSFGGYVGGNFAFLPGKVRPRAGAGMTMFLSSGVRLQARVAGGVELVANRNFAVLIEVGGEVALNPEDDIRTLAIVPALAVTGRL